MNIHILLYLLLSVLSKVCERVDNISGNSLISSALENVTKHLFTLETKMFINNYGVDMQKMTKLLLKNLNRNEMPYQLKNLELDQKEVRLNSSTFLTFNHFENVRMFNEKLVLTNEYFKALQIFVFCQNASVNDIESLASDVGKRAEKKVLSRIVSGEIIRLKAEFMDIIQYEYFLIDEAQFIKLLTFVWYSAGKCSKLQLNEVNRFSKITGKWETNKFAIEKLENFHGCEIVHTTGDNLAGSGFWVNIPHQLQTNLNFINTQLTEGREDKEPSDIIFGKACYNALDKHRNLSAYRKS